MYVVSQLISLNCLSIIRLGKFLVKYIFSLAALIFIQLAPRHEFCIPKGILSTVLSYQLNLSPHTIQQTISFNLKNIFKLANKIIPVIEPQ